jgi:phage portal protein BeeE
MMQFSLVMRGNGYAVKIRNGRGQVIKLIPVNADWVAIERLGDRLDRVLEANCKARTPTNNCGLSMVEPVIGGSTRRAVDAFRK